MLGVLHGLRDKLAGWLAPACLSVHCRAWGPGKLLPTGMSSSFRTGRKMLADVQGLGLMTFFSLTLCYVLNYLLQIIWLSPNPHYFRS